MNRQTDGQIDGQFERWRQSGVGEALTFNQPFSFRSRRALLLGVFEVDDGCRLWFLYDNDKGDTPVPHPNQAARADGTVLSAVVDRLGVPSPFRDPIRAAFLGDASLRVDACRAGTASELYGTTNGVAESLLRRAARHGLPGLTADSMSVVEAHFRESPDFSLFADADELAVTLVFREGYPFNDFLFLPFRLPANLWEGRGPAIEYVDRPSGRAATVTATAVHQLPLAREADLDGICRHLHISLYDPEGARLRKNLAPLIGSETRLALVEYDSVPGRFLEIHLSDFLRRPLGDLEKAIVDINSLLEKDLSRKTCCAGLTPAFASELQAELVVSRAFVPEETVEIMTGATSSYE